MDPTEPAESGPTGRRARQRGRARGRRRQVRQEDVSSQCNSKTTASCESTSPENSLAQEEPSQLQPPGCNCNIPSTDDEPGAPAALAPLNPIILTTQEQPEVAATTIVPVNNNNDGEGDDMSLDCSLPDSIGGDFRDEAQVSQSLLNQPTQVSAARVLFRDHQSGQLAGSHSASYPNIVNANRRLIERQIEAIQMADSRRWNFDFRNCRPLGQTGHRFTHTGCFGSPPGAGLRSCRPLNANNNQDNTPTTTNTTSTSRFIDDQQRWQPRTQGNLQTRTGEQEQNEENG